MNKVNITSETEMFLWLKNLSVIASHFILTINSYNLTFEQQKKSREKKNGLLFETYSIQ